MFSFQNVHDNPLVQKSKSVRPLDTRERSEPQARAKRATGASEASLKRLPLLWSIEGLVIKTFDFRTATVLINLADGTDLRGPFSKGISYNYWE